MSEFAAEITTSPSPTHRQVFRRSIGPCASAGGDTLPEDGVVQPMFVRVERDMQDVTTEGFRTLGIVSTFIAGVEAQCLGLVADAQGDSTTGLLEAAIALLLIGLLLSSFGAAVSLLSARWFDLLRGEETTLLEARWEQARRQSRKDTMDNEKSDSSSAQKTKAESNETTPSGRVRWRDFVLAKAIQYTLLMVFLGFYSFIIGMLLYTWSTRSNITAIVSTVTTLIGTLFIISLHLDFHTRGTLEILHFNRLRV